MKTIVQSIWRFFFPASYYRRMSNPLPKYVKERMLNEVESAISKIIEDLDRRFEENQDPHKQR